MKFLIIQMSTQVNAQEIQILYTERVLDPGYTVEPTTGAHELPSSR
jgi:hypothetical protein